MPRGVAGASAVLQGEEELELGAELEESGGDEACDTLARGRPPPILQLGDTGRARLWRKQQCLNSVGEFPGQLWGRPSQTTSIARCPGLAYVFA